MIFPGFSNQNLVTPLFYINLSQIGCNKSEHYNLNCVTLSIHVLLGLIWLDISCESAAG